jgi:hypothetical protein
MKKIIKFAALTLALVMLFGNTAFAAEATDSMDASSELATEGQDITSEVDAALEEQVSEAVAGSTNDQLVAAAAADVLSGQKVTYTNAAQLSCLVQLGYSCHGNEGPISITKGVLTYKNWWWTEKKDVYVVCLSGTDTDATNTTTGYFTDLLSGFEFDNKYVRNVKKAIQENVPANANLILTGHSLGGMIAQQVAADSDVKAQYNILNTVTFGSPLIDGFDREGMVRRLGDTSDAVPYLSVSTFLNIGWQAAGLNRENGGYGWDVLSAHCESYNRQDVWGAYDVGGEKNGSRTLELDFSTTRFYASPVVVTE